MATPKIKVYKLPYRYNSDYDTDVNSISNDELLPIINKPSLLEDAYPLIGVVKYSNGLTKIDTVDYNTDLIDSPLLDTPEVGFGARIQYADIPNVNLFLTNQYFKPKVYYIDDNSAEVVIDPSHYSISMGSIDESQNLYPLITFFENTTDDSGDFIYEDGYPTGLKISYRKDLGYDSNNGKLVLNHSDLYNGGNELFYPEVLSNQEDGVEILCITNEPENYSATETYSIGDCVLNGNDLYVSLINYNLGNSITNLNYWSKSIPVCYINNETGEIEFYNIVGLENFNPYLTYYVINNEATLFVSNHQNWVIDHLGDNPDIFYGQKDYPGDDRVQGGEKIIAGLKPAYVDEGYTINYREGSISFTNPKKWNYRAVVKDNEGVDQEYVVQVMASYAYYAGIKNVNNQVLTRIGNTSDGWVYKATMDDKRWIGSHDKRWVMRSNVHMPNYFVQKIEQDGKIIEKVMPDTKTVTPYDAVILVQTSSIPQYTGMQDAIVEVPLFKTSYYRIISTNTDCRIRFKFDDIKDFIMSIEHKVGSNESIRIYNTDLGIDTGDIFNGENKSFVINDYQIFVKVIGLAPITFQIYNYVYVGE